MSSAATRTPADVARAAFDAVSRKDPDGIVATGAPGYVDDFVAVGEIRGHDAVRAFFRELFAAFPDFTRPAGTSVPRNVARLCQWTWQCAAPPRGPNQHANQAGYRVIARTFLQASGLS